MADELEVEVLPAAGGSEQLQLESCVRDGEHTLVLRGELDAACAARFESSVRDACEQAPATLVLDLSELAFMDSSGLRVVLFTQALCEQQGIELSIVEGMPQVQRLFAVIGLLDSLPLRSASPRDSATSI